MTLKYDIFTAILTAALITMTVDQSVANQEKAPTTHEIGCRSETQLNNDISLKYVSHERFSNQPDTSMAHHLKTPYQYKF